MGKRTQSGKTVQGIFTKKGRLLCGGEDRGQEKGSKGQLGSIINHFCWKTFMKNTLDITSLVSPTVFQLSLSVSINFYFFSKSFPKLVHEISYSFVPQPRLASVKISD